MALQVDLSPTERQHLSTELDCFMAMQDLYDAAFADVKKEKFANAEKKLHRLLRKKPTVAERASVLGLLGAVYGSQGRLDAAVKSLKQAVDLAPFDPTLLLNFRRCFLTIVWV